MDELVIEDKKYISSKRAASITGYAKDYVGQLCREGYVDARRVGRNWYVLESAIKDHRFGAGTLEDTQSSGEMVENNNPMPHTWDSPRYEAVTDDQFPGLNLLRPEPVPERLVIDEELGNTGTVPLVEQSPEPHTDFQDSWQAWFDMFRRPEPLDEALPNIENIKVQMDQESPQRPYRAVQEPTEPIVIHTLPDPVSRIRTEERGRLIPSPIRPPRGRGVSRFMVMTVMMLIVLSSIAISIIGTGYFDKNIISYQRLSQLAGIIIYNKSSI